MRRLIFKYFWSLSLIYNRHFNFLSWGSKKVQIVLFVLNLIWGCSKCVQICSICILNVAGAALFRSWTEVEETTILNLCSKPIKSNSSNFQDTNRAMIVENARNSNSLSEKDWNSELFQDTNGAIWTHLEQPQSRFKIKCKIWMLFEPQHKNFKCLLKIGRQFYYGDHSPFKRHPPILHFLDFQ
jgi:hypothetical protein